MEQYIPKSVILDEIKRRRDAALERQRNLEAIGQETVLNKMVANELNRIISFTNNLEVKEVNFEKELDDYIYTHDGRKRLALELDWKCCNLTLKGGDEIIKFAKHFFELGLKIQKGE